MAVQFDVTGDNTGFLRALEQSVAAAKKAGGDVNSAFSGVSEIFQSITKAVGIFAAALAGGEAFKEAVASTKELTAESINLGKSMGISASAASEYAVAIDDVGGTTDDVAGATQGLTRQLKAHEGALNDMGIATRDSQGHLRDMNDIMIDAISTVNSYKEGTDRNLAAQTAFGRGMSASNPILKLTKEGMEEAKATAMELGLVVGQQNVRDFEANRKATADAGDVMQGLKKAVGDELLPVLTQFAEWFRAIGPSAIQIMRTAMADLVTVFWTLYAAVNAVWEIIKAMVISVIGPLSALGTAIYQALTGHWEQAKATLAQIGPTLKEVWSSSFDSIVADAQKAAAKIKQAFTDPTGDASPAPGGKDFKTAPKGGGGQEESTQYAQSLIAQANETLDEMKGIFAQEADAYHETQLGEIATKEEALKEQLKLGQVSSAQFLKQENELIEQRLEANREYYAKKLQLETADSVGAAKIQTEITKAEQGAQKQRQQALNTASTAQMAAWRQLGSTIENSFVSNIKGMLEGTESFSQAVKSLFATMIDGIIGIFAKMAIQWAENMLLQKVLGKTTALSQITANAGIAATAAMASVAAIPFYGWAMAPGVGAATFAEAESYTASLSAAGGFDVPAGVNPVVQAHQREMILPEEHADTIRGLKGGGGSPINLNLSAWDGASVDSWLRNGGSAQISAALQKHLRLK